MVIDLLEIEVMIFVGCERCGGLMKLFSFFVCSGFGLFSLKRSLSVFEVFTIAFIKRVLFYSFSIFHHSEIIEEEGKGLRAEKLSQPTKIIKREEEIIF